MPTYEYICKSCGHEFEEFQSMTAPTLRKCPECRKSALERKIGLGGGVIFKGGGFYETDYRSDSYKKSADADTKAASGKTEEKKDTHVHSGTCGCGKKPAEQCGAANVSTEPSAESRRTNPVATRSTAKKSAESKSR